MISSTLEAAKDFLRKIIEEVEDNSLLREDFPELSPAIDAKSQTVSWKDTDIVFQGGQRIIAKGFLNSIRGKRNKQHRPSALIFDDPDEEADVSSETTMIRKVRWFDRAALKLGSFWGIDVLFAYTTISPNCMGEVVHNDSEKYSKKDGWNKKKYKALEKDKNGNEYSTWPEGAPLELLLRERDQDPVTFARERNNENLAEINQKFKGFVQTYEFPLPTNSFKGWYLALGVDISQGKNENSDLSAIVGVGLSPEGKIYEIYNDICRRTPDQIIDDFISALLAFPWNVSGFGLTGSEEYFLLPVRDRIAKYNKENSKKILIPITSLSNTGDKIARDTTALQPIIKTGTLLIRSDSKELIKALDEFPFYYKDGVDALEYAVRLIRQGRATTRPLEKVLEEINKKGQTLKDLKRDQYKRLGLNPDEFGY
ncbi:hypothetical protein BES34_014010 [Leptospira inadai serovar Lyme]|uniref:DNA double-strand break repair nuclease NurA n=2 Tax=Leptospira inadai TaxID=29506 RepID=A0ABX4YGJ3_9LEPT|nr:hypothetical protein BES34_014010 [Leptospira inadai serovar Lyme]